MRQTPAIFSYCLPGFKPWFSGAVITVRVSVLGLEFWTEGGRYRRAIGWEQLLTMLMPDVLPKLLNEQNKIDGMR